MGVTKSIAALRRERDPEGKGPRASLEGKTRLVAVGGLDQDRLVDGDGANWGSALNSICKWCGGDDPDGWQSVRQKSDPAIDKTPVLPWALADLIFKGFEVRFLVVRDGHLLLDDAFHGVIEVLVAKASSGGRVGDPRGTFAMADKYKSGVRAGSDHRVGEDLSVGMWGLGTQWGRGSDGSEEPGKRRQRGAREERMTET